MNEYETVPRQSFAGIPTFLKADVARPEELSGDVDAGVLGVPFDGGVTRRPGARFGPGALRRASGPLVISGRHKGGVVNIETNQRVDYDDLSIRDCNDVPTVPNDIERTRDNVAAYVGAVAERTFPVVLGGDHYLTYPAFVGVSKAIGEDCGVIQLDAHTDTTAESSLYGKHYHGSPMALIHQSEHGGYENHAMIGIRGYESTNVSSLEDEEGLSIDYMPDVREKGIEACVRDAIEHATDGVDHVYLTIDIDSVDPAFAPGTGTPEPGGLTSEELLRAITILGQCDEIVAIDLMEVAPTLDPTDATQWLGSKAIVQFLEQKFL